MSIICKDIIGQHTLSLQRSRGCPSLCSWSSEFAFAVIVCLHFETEMLMPCHTVTIKYLSQNVLKRAKPQGQVLIAIQIASTLFEYTFNILLKVYICIGSLLRSHLLFVHLVRFPTLAHKRLGAENIGFPPQSTLTESLHTEAYGSCLLPFVHPPMA